MRWVRPNLFTFSASWPSFWNLNDTKLPKPWKMSLILSNLHFTWTKSCYISLTNIHSFVVQMKHFHWSSRYSCLGNCLVWKVNLCKKTFTLHSWTQMVVIDNKQLNLIFPFRMSILKLVSLFSIQTVNFQQRKLSMYTILNFHGMYIENLLLIKMIFNMKFTWLYSIHVHE